MPSPRVGHTLASSSASNRVFMCGGYSASETRIDSINKVSKQCFILDLETNQWRSLPDLKMGVSYATSIYIETRKRLMIIGGYHNKQKVNYVQILDLDAQEWRLSLVHYPLATFGHCSVSVSDSVIFSTGGWNDVGGDLTSTFSLETGKTGESNAGGWQKVSSMRVGRATHACLATRYKVKQH